MTAIVAVGNGTEVAMGADHSISYDQQIIAMKNAKIFKAHCKGDVPLLVGVSGKLRSLQLLEHLVPYWDISIYPEDPLRAIVRELLPKVRTVMMEHDMMQSVDGVKQMVNTHIVLGVHGRVYYVDNDFAVHTPICNYTATGSGCDYALGSLAGIGGVCLMENLGGAVRLALEAANLNVASVCPPFTILTA